MHAPDASAKRTFVAIDFGRRLTASEDGIPEHAYEVRVPGKRSGTTKYAGTDDVLVAFEQFFQRGLDVVTEATTAGSFGVRDFDALEALLADYPEREIYTINPRATANECKRNGVKRSEHGALDDKQAAAAIFTCAQRSRRRWVRPDPDERPFKVDPLRGWLPTFVWLREHGYPTRQMDELVWRFLPPFHELDDYQRLVMGGSGGYAPDRAAALVCSLREPLAQRSREGFGRIIGDHQQRRGTAYSQVLVTGKRRKDYRYKYHYSGLTMSEARRALRSLRQPVLRRLAGIGTPVENAGIPSPVRRRPSGIRTPAFEAGIGSPDGRQTSLFEDASEGGL